MRQNKIMPPLWTEKIMQPLGISQDKKNHTTAWGKKEMHYFGTKKITQPLVTTKSQVTSRNKKNHATSWDKIKSRKLSGQKNQATSRDNKKSHNLLGQKIMQPLGTKKSHNLSQQKIMQPLRTKKKL